MKKRILLSLAIILVICAVAVIIFLFPKEKHLTPPTINGTDLSNFTIVYDHDGLDYNQRAAEYIKNEIFARYGLTLEIIDDDSTQRANEIVVGETSRPISTSLEAPTHGLEFAIFASDGSVALEGDYFVIAAAAYYFMDTYASNDGAAVSIPETASIHTPIVKEAKNFILLIGDGMGVYQTRLFEYMENNCEFGDGEDIFYGYMLPYMGYSRTNSLSGTTDSAAGGTALACGTKTYNKYLGLDGNKNEIKSLTELAFELQKSAGVMSTEANKGATPSSFVVHVDDRYNSSAVIDAHFEAEQKYGTVINCGFDFYDASYMSVIDNRIDTTLGKVSANENGFFLMYEEAYIDKHCDDNDFDKAFQALIRFNQAIARFMEFAFYNPDTFVLITADHETGGLAPDADGKLAFSTTEHTSADVPVFAYGCGAEMFNGLTVENIQISHTIAALMGEENFGDQSVFQSLTKQQNK